MSNPHVSRPRFPEGYLHNPTRWLAWAEVEARLQAALHYWLVTVSSQGRPHAVPLWGVWVGGCFYFDGSPQTRHARNLHDNPQVIVHLESGAQVVIVEGEGMSVPRPEPPLAAALAAAYGNKYATLGYTPAPTQWDEGGLYRVVPRKVLAWNDFTQDPTRFIFPSG
ncbi:pyridoxamine 5'-phosphate oxidase family protein [Thermanaerothrix sp. 4228-RoL]|uniref:Pyridoxamine 5'-phosphate oxidase family protein n=1 Tax=Thermanaerothrix solaris TaxID=3058434 RepID=A0ABU3NP68_9CHLR|nr:pyridoxamine 5'-phosphate oxidase family protein [Thermanaerothrix sp. 4228-RoL]MDT8898639.1 pyridoxamine 5'-phosphate oxidase family protein [Thermanaerothrix sp. 4228-RoL]